MNIGFICICTGKYILYLDQLLSSFITNFVPDTNKFFFVFTDEDIPTYIEKYQTDKIKIIYIKQKNIGWPYDSLYRFKMINKNKELLNKYNLDNMFFCNINLKCRSLINLNEIIISDIGMIACLHPGYYKKTKFSYEKNPNSTAYIKKGNEYYQGCFFGGDYKSFMKMSDELENNIDIDEKKGIIAIWHDESHLNCYFNKYKPINVLEPNYAYPGEYYRYPNIYKFKNNIKIEQLTKNHKILRKYL